MRRVDMPQRSAVSRMDRYFIYSRLIMQKFPRNIIIESANNIKTFCHTHLRACFRVAASGNQRLIQYTFPFPHFSTDFDILIVVS